MLKEFYTKHGAVIYSSIWEGWVPVDDCGTKAGPADLAASRYTISNLKISGQVVQGPTPTECSGPPPPPPSPAPPSPPSPPSPSPGGQCCYNSGCTGCNAKGTYCSNSQQNCETNCHGHWCSSGAAEGAVGVL